MLISVHLKNFRRHEDLQVAFSGGLNTIRGANEGGKTTIIEAICYALYGTAALRDTLAETVTWGQKESALSVKLILKAGDVMYSFYRSKGGAEITGSDNTKVTGQKEVSAFAAELLGADAKTAPLLMLASQAGLRGALDEGPAAVSGLMAKLADFDIVDKLVETAQKRLPTGATAPYEQKIAQAESDIEDLKKQIPDPELEAPLVQRLGQLQADLEAMTKLGEEKLHPAVTDSQEVLDRADEANTLYTAAERKVADLVARLGEQRNRLARAQEQAATKPSEEELGAAIKAAMVESDFEMRRKFWDRFNALPKFPEVFWEGGLDSFNEAIEAASKKVNDLKDTEIEAQSAVARAEARYMSGGKCPTCGHEKHSQAEIDAHNAEIKALAGPLRQALMAARTALQNAVDDARDLRALESLNRTFIQRYDELGSFIELDHSTVPARAKWKGEVPDRAPDGSKARELDRIKKASDAAIAAQGEVKVYQRNIEALVVDHDAAVEALSKRKKVDLTPLRQAHQDAYDAYMKNAEQIRTLKSDRDLIQGQINTMRNTREVVERQMAEATRRIAEYREDIKLVERNNVLMAKLRKIKPAITDHLWNITLGAVSTFFSSMRGEHSVVSKDKDGFKVNGKSVDSLSGSTIDVLALATRVALTRTFIPHASFIVLDEPAHGCDNERTGNVLGFLASAGFTQVILASHDELSESVADNVIAVTA